jgi:uncharacterized membrane protein
VGSGHSHSHLPEDDEEEWAATPVPIRRILAASVGLIVLVTVVGLVAWWPRGDAVIETDALGFSDRVEADVLSVDVEGCSYDESVSCDVIRASVEGDGDDVVPDVAVLEFEVGTRSAASSVGEGDGIVLNDAGPDVPEFVRYTFADVQRSTPLVVLVLLFAAAVVALGRVRGLLAIVGLAGSLGVLLYFTLPALLRGSPPVAVALTTASVIALGALYLAHGFNERTTVAVLGTFSSLVLVAVLAGAFAEAAHLSGLASEESINLLAFAPDLDFRGLLLAAAIIGALGVLDDVTVTQVAAVTELHRSDPTATARTLYAAGVRIGRDHIASTVNTLVLAYAAAALPLLLIYTQSGLSTGEVLTSETVAVEVVQTLVGSVGLVASVPITTALAAWVISRR